MVDERYGGENMNIQSIVSAVTWKCLKNADVELVTRGHVSPSSWSVSMRCLNTSTLI